MSPIQGFLIFFIIKFYLCFVLYSVVSGNLCAQSLGFAVESLTLYISKPMSYAVEKKKTERVFQLSPFQYPDPGSNRDGLPHWCLRPARLPIPPSGHLLKCDAKVRLFSLLANIFLFFLKKTFVSFAIPLKRSNFASRLLSVLIMGFWHYRSLS